MWKYKGFFIINHQDIGYYAVYPETATAFNVVQACVLLLDKESCIKYIDKWAKEN